MSHESTRPVRKRLALAVGVVGALAFSACSPLHQRATLTRPNGQGSDRMGQSTSMSADGTLMAVGSPQATSGGKSEAGVVTIYTRDSAGVDWTKVSEFGAASPYEEGHFGSSVSMSGDGNTLVVGAPQQNGKGAAIVFRRSDGAWDTGKTLGLLERANDGVGTAVSISNNGKVVAIGAPYQSVSKNNVNYTKAGRVWVYEDVAGVWTLRTLMNASILQNDESFGRSVAVSGDGTDVVVGMPSYDMYSEAKKAVQTDSGRAELFRRSGNTWTFSYHLTDEATILASALVGSSVGFSSDGSTIAVGAPGYATTVAGIGAVVTYKKVNNGWSRTATLSSNAYPSAQAGTALAVSSDGEYIAVGSPGYNTSDGAVQLLKRTDTGYDVAYAYTDATDAGNGMELGRAVAMSSDAMVIAGGAPSSVNFTGAVRMFDRFTKPESPTGATSTAADGSALVSWTAPVDNGGLALTYTVTSNPDAKTCTSTATSCIVTGLTNGTAYTFRVAAKNAAGQSQGSSPSASVTPSAAVSVATVIGTVPGAPTSVTVNPGWKRANVSWKAPISDGGQRVHTFIVTSVPDGQTCMTFGATECTITGLKAKRQYAFSVVAINVVGSSAASTSEKVALQPKVSLRGGPTAAKLAAWRGIANGIGETTSISLRGKAAKQNCKIVDGKLIAKVAQADCKVRVTSKYVKTLKQTVIIRTVRR